MNKGVICINPFSDKFNYFKYKFVLYSGNIDKDISKIKINYNFKGEAVNLNMEYFKKIKDIIESLYIGVV
jgi:hypothetical protein